MEQRSFGLSDRMCLKEKKVDDLGVKDLRLVNLALLSKWR